MKKGLKKFLGVAMVSGISASASAIGSNYCGAIIIVELMLFLQRAYLE